VVTAKPRRFRQVEAKFASTFSACFHRRANADGQGNAEGGWKCGSKVMENKFPEKVSAAIAIATLLIV